MLSLTRSLSHSLLTDEITLKQNNKNTIIMNNPLNSTTTFIANHHNLHDMVFASPLLSRGDQFPSETGADNL